MAKTLIGENDAVPSAIGRAARAVIAEDRLHRLAEQDAAHAFNGATVKNAVSDAGARLVYQQPFLRWLFDVK